MVRGGGSHAALTSAITKAAHAPLSDKRREIIDLYVKMGPAASAATLQTCMKILKDQDEGVKSKLTVLRIMDCLMEFNDAGLATEMAKDGKIKVLVDIAVKHKEKDIKKWRPPGLSKLSSKSNATEYIVGCAEFLDKWGSRFEGFPSPLKDFSTARKSLMPGLQGPDHYRYIDRNFTPLEEFDQSPRTTSQDLRHATHFPEEKAQHSSGHHGTHQVPLDEDLFSEMVHEYHTLQIQHGAGDSRTREVRGICEAELKRWQEAAHAAAENDDFVEFERLSNVAHHFSNQLDTDDAGPPPGPSMGRPQGDLDEPGDHRRRKKEKKHGQHTEAVADAPTIWPTESAPNDFSEQSHHWGHETSTGQKRSIADLEAELYSLQAELAHEYEMRHSASNKNVADAKSLKPALRDARASVAHLEAVNIQLNQELHYSRTQLREARQAALDAEDRLADVESQLTQTRERLFKQHHKSVELEDDLKRHSDLHGDLHSQLEAKHAEHVAHELAVRRAKHAFGTMKGEAGYGNPFQRGASGVDNQAPLQRLANEHLENFPASGSAPGRHLVLRRTAPEVWRRTQHAAPTSGPPVLRSPPGSSEWLERAEVAFRNLLVQRKGVLYRDDRVAIEMATFGTPLGSSHRPVINFELTALNHGGHAVHDVRLVAQRAAPSDPFELRIQPQSEQDASGQLARRPNKYWGELEITGPFEAWPRLIFSYLLADNQSCKALIRLPLAITRLLSPARMEKERFIELWKSDELAHHEVAFICSVREEFLAIGVSFSLAKCLEFGGSLHCIPGLDETPGSAVLAALTPAGHGEEQPAEVLVRAELQGPSSGKLSLPGVASRSAGSAHAQQCRVAIRSTSHSIGRALGRVILEVLSKSKDA